MSSIPIGVKIIADIYKTERSILIKDYVISTNIIYEAIENAFTEREKQIIKLHYEQEKTYIAIAAICDIASSTVNQHRMRIMEKFIRYIFKHSKKVDNLEDRYNEWCESIAKEV